MKANEVIQIKPMELRNQKMDSDGELRLEFYEKHFTYIGDFFAEEPKDREDHSLGWETIRNYFEIIIDKNAVAGFEKSWNQTHNHWSIYIFVNGMAEDIKLFFKTQLEADAVAQKLINYLYA